MTGPARFLPHLVMTTLITIWSYSFVESKVALRSLSPFALVACRFWLAIGCLLPFVLRGRVLADLRAAFAPGLSAGLALATGYLLQMAGMTGTSASMGGLLAGLIVPLVALGGFLFFHAKLGGKAITGLLLAIAGIATICWPSGGGGGQDTLRGILLQVGSSTSYAAHVLLLSRFGRSAPIAAFAFWQLLVTALAGTIAAASLGEFGAQPDLVVTWHRDLLFAVGYLGVLATAVGIGVQSLVQHKVPPTHLALLFALQPLIAALCGVLFQGDALGVGQIVGGALIVLGVVVTSAGR